VSLDLVAPWQPWHPGPGGRLRPDPGGLWCGAHAGGAPAVLDVFRPAGTTVLGLAGVPVAVLLALRAAAAGADVAVAEPTAAWRRAAAAAGPGVLDPAGAVERAGTFARPRVVDHTRPEVPAGRPPPWCVRLVPSVPLEPRTLTGADVVVLGPLADEQVALVVATWRAGAEVAAALRAVRRPWQLAIMADRRFTVVDLLPQPGEQDVLRAADGADRPAGAAAPAGEEHGAGVAHGEKDGSGPDARAG
jgi:hypothetical protein